MSRRTTGLAAVLLLLCLSLLSPATSFAATPKTTLQEVEAELMCATCKVPLNQSEAPQANQERATIERLIAEGRTKDQIIDEMVHIYTDSVLLNPPDKGVRTLRWAIPAAVGLFAVVVLAVLILRWRRRAAAEGTDGVDAPGGGPGAGPGTSTGLPPSADGGTHGSTSGAASGPADADDSGDGLSDEDRRRLDSDLARYE
jgi:cytochrome c-type biogenesis protein CcmH